MTSERPPLAWVIGRGGLLGAATERALWHHGDVWTAGPSFTWGDRAVMAEMATATAAFAQDADGRPWTVAWCAGAGVVASSAGSLNAETMALRALLDALGTAVTDGTLGVGALFHASSAGGVYAGSDAPPFDETSTPRPLSAYGEEKLVQEALVTAWATEHDADLLIGRIANLYGPGQNLAKAQGLISQVCSAQITQHPLSIYVPLGTLRHYLYAPDCGAMVAAGLVELRRARRRTDERSCELKVLASTQPVSIAEILAQFRRISRRSPRISLRPSPLGQLQVRDLRMRSTRLTRLDRLASTPLPVGLFATYGDLRRRHALGWAASP